MTHLSFLKSTVLNDFRVGNGKGMAGGMAGGWQGVMWGSCDPLPTFELGRAGPWQ